MEKTYSGSCHCGAVRFEAQVDLADTVVCNCSICTMRGFIWSFIPAGRFRLVSGKEHLRKYQFYKHVIDHRFCSICGVEPFAHSAPNGVETAMINVRCLKLVDLASPSPRLFYGLRV